MDFFQFGLMVMTNTFIFRLGRRQLGILFFVAAASFSFATFIQYFAARSFFDTRRHIFVIIARFWLSSAWSIATMMIQEVFPTSVRYERNIGISKVHNCEQHTFVYLSTLYITSLLKELFMRCQRSFIVCSKKENQDRTFPIIQRLELKCKKSNLLILLINE